MSSELPPGTPTEVPPSSTPGTTPTLSPATIPADAPSPPTPATLQFFWETLQHEDNLFTNRCNFFLVGESMLLTAAATLLTTKEPANPRALTILYAAGVIVSAVWLLVSVRHLHSTLRPIKHFLHNHHGPFSTIRAWRDRPPWNWYRIHVMMGWVLPIVFLMTWLALWVS
jgi:hypothetical protein